MKYIWQRCDITSGRRVHSHNRAEEYIIGYDPLANGPDKWTLTSLRDGMLASRGLTTTQIVEQFNGSNGRDHGMRPLAIQHDIEPVK